jgi:hypothetical protein
MLAKGLIRNARHAMFGGDIESPWVISGGALPTTPPRRNRDDDNVPLPDLKLDAGEDDSMSSFAAQISSSVQYSVAGALTPTQRLAQSASIMNASLLREMNNTLKQLVALQPSPTALAQANNVVESRFS